MDKASDACYLMLDQLRLDRAGRHGPVEDRWIYDAMCSPQCRESDEARQEAMAVSGCNCLELSTQPGDPAYHIDGDWCLHNTGRMLCDVFDQCGVWACSLNDFMCPRLEYNRYKIRFRGPGSCAVEDT
ncbi:unnamed protein product [Chrysoparadoxa australica]